MNAAAKVPVSCPKCGKQLMVPTTAAGKQGRCPACTHVFLLPALLEVPESDELPQLAPLASDPFGQSVPTSGYQLQATAPQAYPPASYPYGSPPAQQPYAQQPLAQQPMNPHLANAYAEAAQRQSSDKYNHGFGMEQRGWDAGMMGGLAMMGLSVLIFAGAWALGYFVPYTLILFIIGLVGFFRGLFTGNIAGRSE